MLRHWVALLGLCLLTSAAVAQTGVTGFKVVSTPGEFVGQGQTYVYDTPDQVLQIRAKGARVLITQMVPDDHWHLDFSAPGLSLLQVGDYPAAERLSFGSPLRPGMDVGGLGRGCNTVSGWFRVHEYMLDDSGRLRRLAIDFMQYCGANNSPLYGAVRYMSSVPLKVPLRAAVAGTDQGVIESDPVELDGSQSFSRHSAGKPVFQWTQIAGPAVTLERATSLHPRFVAPAVPLEGATLRFRLDMTDGSGVTVSDDVLVMVNSALTARTELSFDGPRGEYVTDGERRRYLSDNASISVWRNADGGVSALVSGDTWWSLDTAPASGQGFGNGRYTGAQRYLYQAPGHPGLTFAGSGRSCNTLNGDFQVRQARFAPDGSLRRVELAFEQHCEGAAAAAKGQLLFNAVPQALLARQLAAARAVHPRGLLP